MSELPAVLTWLPWVNLVLLVGVGLSQAGLYVRVSRSVKETRDLLQLVKTCQGIAGRQQDVAARMIAQVPDAMKTAIQEVESESGMLRHGRPCR